MQPFSRYPYFFFHLFAIIIFTSAAQGLITCHLVACDEARSTGSKFSFTTGCASPYAFLPQSFVIIVVYKYICPVCKCNGRRF